MNRHHMLAFRRERRIVDRRNRDVEIRLSRKLAVLRRVKRAFEVINLRPDVNPPAEFCFRIAVNAAKGRQTVEREIQLPDRARRAIVAQLQQEVWIEIDRIDEVEKSRARI